MPFTALNGPTIRAGESLSNSIDCTGNTMIRIITPDEWTAAVLSFQASYDNITFHDVFDFEGYEITRTIVPNVTLIVDPAFGRSVAWLKFRSGSRVDPVPQETDRQFTTIIEK